MENALESREMKVSKIRDGIVFDHLPAESSIKILKVLNLPASTSDSIISILMNAHSSKYGKKDIIKVENLELGKELIDRIFLVAPNATINFVKDYEIVEKRKSALPKSVLGIIKCKNPNCITRKEQHAISKFSVIGNAPFLLKCDYCGQTISSNEILDFLN
ncbi:MAG: aspartate carbamoyltransferase regulatory subunit [Candidatus Micrarchaeia archaeon]